MATNEETLALAHPNPFHALIQKVMENPTFPAETLKVLVDMELQIDDRRAEKEFNDAMRLAQKKMKPLKWDRINKTNDGRYVSYPKIDEMLRPIMEEHGFTMSFTTEPDPRPDMMQMIALVSHDGGHTRPYPLPMPISGAGPKGGGVMTGQQAVKSGASYGMRTLAGMIWNIPMLVDRDDVDGNAPTTTVSEAQVKELRKLFDRLGAPRQRKALEHFKLDVPESEPLHTALANLPAKGYNNALKALATALKNDGTVTITPEQEATLVSLIDEIGGKCRQEFLTTHQIKKVGELRADQYQGALKALQEKRRNA